jgi:hypothetical protein
MRPFKSNGISAVYQRNPAESQRNTCSREELDHAQMEEAEEGSTEDDRVHPAKVKF